VGDLFVEMGREEEKTVMAPPDPAPTFMDAAFAEDQTLGSATKRGADEGPFFKTNSRQGRGHTKGIKRERERLRSQPTAETENRKLEN
jgi:hypothetical protein